MGKEELIRHAIKAVKTSAQSDVELNGKSVSVAIVGVDTPFRFLPEEEVNAVLGEFAQAMDIEA